MKVRKSKEKAWEALENKTLTLIINLLLIQNQKKFSISIMSSPTSKTSKRSAINKLSNFDNRKLIWVMKIQDYKILLTCYVLRLLIYKRNSKNYSPKKTQINRKVHQNPKKRISLDMTSKLFTKRLNHWKRVFVFRRVSINLLSKNSEMKYKECSLSSWFCRHKIKDYKKKNS